MGFENNIYGSVHPENKYNTEDEDRDRKNFEGANRNNAPKGHPNFIPVEEYPDENAEEEIYNQVQQGVDEQWRTPDRDKFGFVSDLADIFPKVAQDKKEDFLNKTTLFLNEYQKIINSEMEEEEAYQASLKAFNSIIGKQFTSYYVKVRDKKAPLDAYHVKYDDRGRPVDPDSMLKKANHNDGINNRNIKTKTSKPGLQMPWRR